MSTLCELFDRLLELSYIYAHRIEERKVAAAKRLATALAIMIDHQAQSSRTSRNKKQRNYRPQTRSARSNVQLAWHRTLSEAIVSEALDRIVEQKNLSDNYNVTPCASAPESSVPLISGSPVQSCRYEVWRTSVSDQPKYVVTTSPKCAEVRSNNIPPNQTLSVRDLEHVDPEYKCSCNFFLQYRYPCRHLIRVFMYLQLDLAKTILSHTSCRWKFSQLTTMIFDFDRPFFIETPQPFSDIAPTGSSWGSILTKVAESGHHSPNVAESQNVAVQPSPNVGTFSVEPLHSHPLLNTHTNSSSSVYDETSYIRNDPEARKIHLRGMLVKLLDWGAATPCQFEYTVRLLNQIKAYQMNFTPASLRCQSLPTLIPVTPSITTVSGSDVVIANPPVADSGQGNVQLVSQRKRTHSGRMKSTGKCSACQQTGHKCNSKDCPLYSTGYKQGVKTSLIDHSLIASMRQTTSAAALASSTPLSLQLQT